MNYRFMYHLFVFVTISIILLIFTGPKASSLGLLFLLLFFVIIVFLYVNELLELYNWIRTLPEASKSLKTKGKKISYKELIKTGMVKFLFAVIPMIIIPVVIATIFMPL